MMAASRESYRVQSASNGISDSKTTHEISNMRRYRISLIHWLTCNFLRTIKIKKKGKWEREEGTQPDTLDLRKRSKFGYTCVNI